jgi:hypothetical protein
MKIIEIYEQYNISLAQERRKTLIDNMQNLISEKKDCFSCKGYCCTYQNNSMQVTPLEALDAYYYLDRNNLINSDLIQSLKETIQKFRLDIEVPTRNGKFLRRYYTCPFFKEGSKGCGLSLEDKPYGCLGFNPKETGVKTEGYCESDQDLLEQRQNLFFEESEYNETLKNTLDIYWDKRNLPWAIINLIEKFQLKN